MEKSKKPQKEVIMDLQNNPEYIILNNPLSAPKFVKGIGKNKEERPMTDIYTPKIFFEIISKLTPLHLENSNGKYIQLDFNVSEFLDTLGLEKKDNFYKNVLNSVYEMQKLTVKYETDKAIGSYSVIPSIEYKKDKGDLTLDLNRKLVEKILEIKSNENFSFLKKYLYLLQNAQAIKVFPYLVSWKNRGMVELSVDTFKKIFGYNTDGYNRFNKLQDKVIDPAINEITEKTMLNIKYTLIGKNLEGIRPRVKAIRFFITEKAKNALKTGGFEAEKAEIIGKEADNKANDSNEKEMLYTKYEKIVVAEFGVNGFQFSKLLDTCTEGGIINAIEITKKTKESGKIKNIAGFFVEALKNGYIDQAEIEKKEQIEKRAKMKAQEAEIKLKEAAEKTRQKAVFEADAERIIKILEGNLALQKKVLDAFLSDFVGKTTFKGKGFKEILESPMGKGMLIGIAKKFEI